MNRRKPAVSKGRKKSLTSKVVSNKEIEQIKKKHGDVASMAAVIVNSHLELAGNDLVKKLMILRGAIFTGIVMGKFEQKINKIVNKKNGKS